MPWGAACFIDDSINRWHCLLFFFEAIEPLGNNWFKKSKSVCKKKKLFIVFHVKLFKTVLIYPGEAGVHKEIDVETMVLQLLLCINGTSTC